MTRYLLRGLWPALLLQPVLAGGEDNPHELGPVVVTAAPLALPADSLAQPATVLEGDRLLQRLAPTLGETLAAEPGLRSTWYGPAASRPLVRGLGGDRVQLLSDGLALPDASALSEDHAVSLDPALADQIEVIRGPATLIYGSGAAGGLVNVVTQRLHAHLPDGLSGMADLRADTALGERGLAARLDAPAGRTALHLDGSWRETRNFDTPLGRIAGSWSETRAGGLGVNHIGDSRVLGLALTRHQSDYGLPTGEDLSIDLLLERLDLALRQDLALGPFTRLELRGAASDYRHAELEQDGEVGTRYDVDGRELRATLSGQLAGGARLLLGSQWLKSQLAAAGEEAFVPGSRTRTGAAFAWLQWDRAPGGTLEFGLRLDRQTITPADGLPRYADDAVNASLGWVRPLAGGWSLLAQLSRTERHPGATELYADGPHAATGQFERGDPGFGKERGLTADLGLRGVAAGWDLELRVFTSRYGDFLFLAPTGEVEDDLPVHEFHQAEARFRGVEAAAQRDLDRDGRWRLELGADVLRGRRADGEALPRLPPWRASLALARVFAAGEARLLAEHHAAQDRLAPQETPSPSYTLLGLELTLRPAWLGADGRLYLRASNLLDEVARVHSSPLKDQLPLPGRSLAAGLRVGFGR